MLEIGVGGRGKTGRLHIYIKYPCQIITKILRLYRPKKIISNEAGLIVISLIFFISEK